MPTVDVVCPPGVSAGDLISVAIGNHTFEVSLPPNVFDGDTFSVDIPDAPVMELPVLGGVVAALDARGTAYGDADVLEAALHTVIDAIEDHDNPALDELVDGNCEEFAEWEEGCEAQLHWTQMHETYSMLLEEHIGGVLASLQCSAEDVFMYAQAYSSDDERCKKLVAELLAMGEFTDFCKMMRMRHEILSMFG